MQRVKNVGYDDDDLFDDEDVEQYGDEAEQFSAEDRQNLATLTPVVRAELEEAGVQASDKEIQDSLWHYYWDAAKSVSYLKTTKTPKTSQPPTAKKEKSKSKFDQAAEKRAKIAGESWFSFYGSRISSGSGPAHMYCNGQRGGLGFSHARDQRFLMAMADCLPQPPLSAAEWFRDTPWTQVPSSMKGVLVPCEPLRPPPKLLGGSSKLAKLAEERRKKAAAANQAPTSGTPNSLDRLSRSGETKENNVPAPAPEPKKYPIRKKREPTPPPREPTPPPTEVEEIKPDLRASPSAFGRALSTNFRQDWGAVNMPCKEILGSDIAEDPFKGPSPDDTVMNAQRHSKGLTK